MFDQRVTDSRNVKQYCFVGGKVCTTGLLRNGSVPLQESGRTSCLMKNRPGYPDEQFLSLRADWERIRLGRERLLAEAESAAALHKSHNREPEHQLDVTLRRAAADVLSVTLKALEKRLTELKQ